ncbi:hypothetical protein QVD17_38950 [Tagetes erecta]|uniref:Uncharacterized protein n=1 Tax=Tagetes erecta TaxID=13708 RepID=A0AAD8JRE9_TARER|nr:hypothetical protein QVD17_38950 [Tagetes erecta]
MLQFSPQANRIKGAGPGGTQCALHMKSLLVIASVRFLLFKTNCNTPDDFHPHTWNQTNCSPSYLFADLLSHIF